MFFKIKAYCSCDFNSKLICYYSLIALVLSCDAVEFVTSLTSLQRDMLGDGSVFGDSSITAMNSLYSCKTRMDVRAFSSQVWLLKNNRDFSNALPISVTHLDTADLERKFCWWKARE